MLSLLIELCMPVIVLILILMVATYLGEGLLGRKLNPNEDYLNEIEEIQQIGKFKILSWINRIGIFIIIITPNFKNSLIVFLAISIIIELIRSKYKLEYLSTKLENESTCQYILYQLGLTCVLFIIMLTYYFVYDKIF